MQDTEIKEDASKEIDIREFVMIIARRKRLIFGISLAVAAMAFVLSLAMPKTYLVSTSLQIGSIASEDGQNKIAERLIEDPNQIKIKEENDIYGVLVRQKLGIDPTKYPRITMEIGEKSAMIFFSAEFSDAELGKKVMRQLNEVIISDHTKKFNNAKAVFEKNIEIEKNNEERLASKINSLKSEQSMSQAMVNNLRDMFYGSFKIENELVMYGIKSERETIKQEIEDSYYDMNQSKRLTNVLRSYADIMQPTVVIKDPYATENQKSSNAGLNSALGLVVGFFAGLFFAFLIEWWNKPRQ